MQHALRSSPANKLRQNLWPPQTSLRPPRECRRPPRRCVGVGRGARCQCFRFQGSTGILRLSRCKWMISSQGTYTGNTVDHKHPLIPRLCLCVSLRSNSITQICPRILTRFLSILGSIHRTLELNHQLFSVMRPAC